MIAWDCSRCNRGMMLEEDVDLQDGNIVVGDRVLWLCDDCIQSWRRFARKQHMRLVRWMQGSEESTD